MAKRRSTGTNDAGTSCRGELPVAEDGRRVAVQGGPLLYCLEELDQSDGVALSNIAVQLEKDPASQFETEHRPDALDGVLVLHHTGAVIERPGAELSLYSRYSGAPKKTTRPH